MKKFNYANSGRGVYTHLNPKAILGLCIVGQAVTPKPIEYGVRGTAQDVLVLRSFPANFSVAKALLYKFA